MSDGSRLCYSPDTRAAGMPDTNSTCCSPATRAAHRTLLPRDSCPVTGLRDMRRVTARAGAEQEHESACMPMWDQVGEHVGRARVGRLLRGGAQLPMGHPQQNNSMQHTATLALSSAVIDSSFHDAWSAAYACGIDACACNPPASLLSAPTRRPTQRRAGGEREAGGGHSACVSGVGHVYQNA